MNQPVSIERAILETLAYSDIFDYPLRLDEIHRYLSLRADEDEIRTALARSAQVDCRAEFYFLKGSEYKVDIRLERAVASLRTFNLAARYGLILGSLPFVRMVAITGSLATQNLSKGADIDYMLVTQPDRLWIARAFAVTFGRVMRIFGNTICVNLLVSENALPWLNHDLYSAREMCQMIPITGMDVYQRLRAANTWTESFLPNAISQPGFINVKVKQRSSALQKLIELILSGKGGVKLEHWVMKFQLDHIAYRGQSVEARFSANVCQGNFHHHRQWTHDIYQERLCALGIKITERGL